MEHGQLDSQEWLEIEAGLGGAAALARSAREHAAFIRPRGVKSASDLLRLALMYGPGGQSLRALAARAAAAGVADVSDVALLNRLRGAADWLEALCRQHLAKIARTLGVDGLGRALRIVDGSRLEGPGKRAWRLHLCYAPDSGRLVDAAITTLQKGERLDTLAIEPGEIRLGDRAFPQPYGLRNTVDAGGDVLVRLTWNSLHLSDAKDAPIDWLKLFERAAVQGAIDMPVRVHKARGRFEPLPLRLVIIKKPSAAAAKARAKARKASRKDQRRRTDPRTLAAAEHLVLLTSLPPDAFPIDRLGALYRLRWQIELAFKRLKSILRIDRLPAKDPRLARTWLHAHLLFALLVDEAKTELDALPP